MDDLYMKFLPEYSEYEGTATQAHFYYHAGYALSTLFCPKIFGMEMSYLRLQAQI